jgi:hypothetical protein
MEFDVRGLSGLSVINIELTSVAIKMLDVWSP